MPLPRSCTAGVRPRAPQCMMKSYDTSKPYDAASSPEPLGEEEEELMATLVEPAEAEPAAVEPAADDTAAIGDDEQELLMALRRARARGGRVRRAGVLAGAAGVGEVRGVHDLMRGVLRGAGFDARFEDSRGFRRLRGRRRPRGRLVQGILVG